MRGKRAVSRETLPWAVGVPVVFFVSFFSNISHSTSTPQSRVHRQAQETRHFVLRTLRVSRKSMQDLAALASHPLPTFSSPAVPRDERFSGVLFERFPLPRSGKIWPIPTPARHATGHPAHHHRPPPCFGKFSGCMWLEQGAQQAIMPQSIAVVGVFLIVVPCVWATTFVCWVVGPPPDCPSRPACSSLKKIFNSFFV